MRQTSASRSHTDTGSLAVPAGFAEPRPHADPSTRLATTIDRIMRQGSAGRPVTVIARAMHRDLAQLRRVTLGSGVATDRRPVALAALLIGSLAAAPAAADPAAEQMFRDAKQLLKDGRLDEACEKFAASQHIESKSGTLLNLADCRERQGKLATAWDMFLQAKALASREQDSVRAAEAARRADAIAPRRAFITIELPTEGRPPGLSISRDGVDVPAPLWNVEVPIDPGRYVVVAQAPGHAPQTTTVEVERGARATARLAALVALPSDPADRPDVDDRDRDLPAPPPPPRPKTLGIGPLLGASSDGDLVVGGRIVTGILVPDAVIRGSFAIKSSQYGNDPLDAGNYTDVLAFGIAIDYVRTLHPRFAIGGGLGAGIDQLKPSYQDVATTEKRFSVRASPAIVRPGKMPLELAVHVELVVPTTTVNALVGVDWFFW